MRTANGAKGEHMGKPKRKQVHTEDGQLKLIVANKRPHDMDTATRFLRGNTTWTLGYGKTETVDGCEQVFDLLKVKVVYEHPFGYWKRTHIEEFKLYIPMVESEQNDANRRATIIRAARNAWDWLELQDNIRNDSPDDEEEGEPEDNGSPESETVTLTSKSAAVLRQAADKLRAMEK